MIKSLIALICLSFAFASCSKNENLKNDVKLTILPEQVSGKVKEEKPCDDPAKKPKVEIKEDSINLLDDKQEGCTLK